MNRESIIRVKTLADAFVAAAPLDRPAGKLRFTGVGDRDVYNISTPFHSAGRRVIAGRVEARDSEHSLAIFFEEADDGVWHPIPGAPQFPLQDPFIAEIAGELVFGGVAVDFGPALPVWHTVFYRGVDIFCLREFFAGPVGMKDIRLCELADGRVAIFTRPRGVRGGRGTIGYTEVASLDAMTIAAIEAAPMLDDMFHPFDWGGANDAHLLASGEIGVIAHAAFFEQDILYGKRRYYAMSFVFDPATRTWRDYRVIAAREQFVPGPAKRPDLVDVVFSSGIERDGDRTLLFAGTSDAEAQWLEIDFPFDIPFVATPLNPLGDRGGMISMER